MDIALIKMILSRNLEHLIPKIENKFSVKITNYDVDSESNDDFNEFITNSRNLRKTEAILICSFSIKFPSKRSSDLSDILYRYELEDRNNKTFHIKEFIKNEFGGGNYESIEIGKTTIFFYLIDEETRIL
jgi:hypothetical protein